MEWQGGPYQWRDFQQLKEALYTTLVLLVPDSKPPYIMVTNASATTVDAVLTQDQGDWLQPLVFLNRRLKPREQRYNVYE